MINTPYRMPCLYITNHQIGLRSQEGTVMMFPDYLKEVSKIVRNNLEDIPQEGTPVISIPYPSTTVKTLFSLVQMLPSAARNTSAQQAPVQNIYQVTENINPQTITILVNSLVWNRAFPILNKLSLQEVTSLFRAVNHLVIPSLIHATARFIALQLFDQVMAEKVRLEEQSGSYTLVNVLLTAVRNVTQDTFSDELNTRIAKYIYLQSLGVEEKNIADYIGSNGFPTVVNAKLKLAKKEITGLPGTELIWNDVVEARFSNNYILGNDLDLDFPSNPFSGLENLQKIELQHNRITTLPRKVFWELGNLQTIELQHNQITTLPQEVFQGLGNLYELHLNNNQITTLPPGMFRGLRNLGWLYLSHNQIPTLPSGVFQGLGTLYKLSLNHNQIPTLSPGVFQELGNLNQLYLNNNRITTLPPGVFQGLGKLRYLFLTHNQLTTLPQGVFQGLDKLYHLFLINNRITTLPQGVFRGLGELAALSLDHNQITTLPIGVFQGLGKLEVLNLQSNQITTLPQGVFQGLDKLKHLFLINNRIPGTEEDFKQYHPTLEHVYIRFEPQNPLPSTSISYVTSYHSHVHPYVCFQDPF